MPDNFIAVRIKIEGWDPDQGWISVVDEVRKADSLTIDVEDMDVKQRNTDKSKKIYIQYKYREDETWNTE